ncbi:MAG: response regulator transcription factor [Betaproteobacteria bacterium]|nr:response regulator transcription factor [Betaproteobacteria bacterium]
MRLLVAEDEPQLRTQLCDELKAQGYTVDSTGDGKEGLFFASEYPVDAAIVDLGLPGLSGLEIIRRLRAKGNRVPILVLTARGRWQDKVEGLEAGADDYLTKPFQTEELLARLKALLRRAAAVAQDVLTCGPLTLNFSEQKVSIHGNEIELTTYEYRLLEHLARERRRIVTKDELAAHLYPHEEERDSNVIEVLLGRVRRKLDPDGSIRPLETVRGRGYRLALSEEA